MKNQSIEGFTDLELLELQGQTYQQLMQAQNNLTVIGQEVQRRKSQTTTADTKAGKAE